MTPSEVRLWSAIRKASTGTRFRRQVPIGPWIADFASLGPRIVIEVDGGYHLWHDDHARTAYLLDHGFDLIRFTNEQVRDDLEGVVLAIAARVAELRG
jgi:very-short-patch-repair endonuclease